MFQENPLPRLRRYFPRRGKILDAQIFPLWGKWLEAPKGALFSVFRVPREGGDPDPFTQAERPVYVPPSPNPLPLKGARALSSLALSLRERVG